MTETKAVGQFQKAVFDYFHDTVTPNSVLEKDVEIADQALRAALAETKRVCECGDNVCVTLVKVCNDCGLPISVKESKHEK